MVVVVVIVANVNGFVVVVVVVIDVAFVAWSGITAEILLLLLAAMSSSRSDEVTKCACLSVWMGVILFSVEHSKNFNKDVSRVL